MVYEFTSKEIKWVMNRNEIVYAFSISQKVLKDRSERIVKTECMLAAVDLVTLSFWAEEEQLQFTTVCC